MVCRYYIWMTECELQAKISGLHDHPDYELLKTYNSEPPAERWLARLDTRAWGNSRNLLCYFTDVATGDRHRLSVWSNNNYRPYQDGPAFDEQRPGTLFWITTAFSRTGNPKFLSASVASEGDAAKPPAPGV